MIQGIRTFLLSLAALVLVPFGLHSLILAPFLGLVFIDIDPPLWLLWLNSYSLAGIGFFSTALGVWCWILTWRRCFLKEDAEEQAKKKRG